jgi:hypothetical protein
MGGSQAALRDTLRVATNVTAAPLAEWDQLPAWSAHRTAQPAIRG